MPSSISSSEPAAGSRRFTVSFLVVLAALLVAFGAGSEWLIQTRVIPNHNFYKYRALFRDTRAHDAIFGDSMLAYGLTGLKGFVNLAYGGDDFWNISDKVALFLTRHKLDKVILQASPHHFGREYLWRVGRDDSQIALLQETGHPFPAMLHGLHRREIVGYWEVFLSGRGFTPRQTFEPDGSRLTDENFADVPPRQRRQGARRQASEIAPVKGFAATDVAKGYGALIRRLLAAGAKPCLVTLPVSPELVAASDAIPSYTAARAFFAGLAASAGIRYVDLWREAREESDYADYRHLNARGARAVTPEVMAACFGTTERP